MASSKASSSGVPSWNLAHRPIILTLVFWDPYNQIEGKLSHGHFQNKFQFIIN
jgi:hypothetical protein